MGIKKDLSGKKFGRLTAINESHVHNNRSVVWNVRCDCGKSTKVTSVSLSSGNTKSCGCLQADRTSEARRTHRLSSTSTYRIWTRIKARCLNVNATGYKDYGGRGIEICDRWLKFENFLEDMGERPNGLQIERINNDGNYEPGNCMWATPTAQANNRRTNVLIEYKGQTKTLAEWSRKLGIGRDTIRMRIKSGLSVKEAMETPVGKLKNRRQL